MIIDFISQPPLFANRLSRLIRVCKKSSLLCLLVFIAASVHAQMNTNMTSSANYKRPYDVEKNRIVSANEGQLIITKKTPDGHSAKAGCTWRYSTAPAGLIIITIDSKSNTGKKSQGIKSNYKAQH